MGVMAFSLSLYGMDPRVTDGTSRAMQGLMRLGAFALSIPVLVLLGLPLAESVLRQKRWLSAECLIACGVAAAWAVSCLGLWLDSASVYFETATMVLVLFTLGRWLEVRARERAKSALSTLVPARLPPAQRVVQGNEHAVQAGSLVVGDIVRVRPGDVLPVDGVVVEGRSFLDTSSITGEEQPRAHALGDRVLAGSMVIDGTLLVQATAVSGMRLMDEITRLLSQAANQRAGIVKLADRITAWFSPAVLALTVGTFSWYAVKADLGAALFHALSVVLIACPCALGLATPLAFWVALGEAWKRGMLVRGGDVFERLHRARRVVFDKTGTLTSGDMSLERVELSPTVAMLLDAKDALRLAAALELGSEHPVGRAIVGAWREQDGARLPMVEDFRAIPGVGIEGSLAGKTYRVQRSMGPRALDADPGEETDTRVTLSDQVQTLAEFVLHARVRPEAGATLAELKRRGLHPMALTGDARGPALALERQLGIPVTAELLPHEKAVLVRQQGNQGVLFVGDGLNDAPVLAAADVGISMRTASPTSMETAAVNLMHNDLGLVVLLLDTARAAVNTARGNLVWAFAYNIAGLWLAVAGRLTPVYAALAMVASSTLTVLNCALLRSRLGARSRFEPSANAATQLAPTLAEAGRTRVA